MHFLEGWRLSKAGAGGCDICAGKGRPQRLDSNTDEPYEPNLGANTTARKVSYFLFPDAVPAKFDNFRCLNFVKRIIGWHWGITGRVFVKINLNGLETSPDWSYEMYNLPGTSAAHLHSN